VSDQKTERLINLTMALLATKRFLNKSEIFQSVAGYSGTTETMERMFERDKEDLRTLGIVIEVGTFDPLFEDEPGYRISPSDYRLDLGELTPQEFSYLSLAATLWRNQLFTTGGAQALRKLEGLGSKLSQEMMGMRTLSLENQTPLFPALWQSITTQQKISFQYQSQRLSNRSLAPYGLTLWHGAWYLVGEDLDRNEIRVFKVSRITSEIALVGKSRAFEVPDNFDIKSHLVMLTPENHRRITARVRVGKCQALRLDASVSSIDDEWDRIEFDAQRDWLEKVLWYGDDIIVEEPIEIRDEIVRALKDKL